jgi:hypothetical protein
MFDNEGGTCSTNGRDEKYTVFFVGKHEGKLGRPRRGWKANIRINLKEIG